MPKRVNHGKEPDEMKFEKLFQPIRIGKMEVKNRWVMAAMGTGQADGRGYVTERYYDYYGARAKGGTGLIVVEATLIDWANGRNSDLTMSIDDDTFIPGLAGVAAAIRRHGARAAIQLLHSGAEARIPGQKVAASAIPHRTGQPRELTRGEITELVSRYAAGARRAQTAGFDAVELHGAHGYLIAQFLSPTANKRQDEYGGDVVGRARFLIEILQAIRRTVGPDFPVWPRLNSMEFGIEGGATLEDMHQVARMAQDAGADAISLSIWAGPQAGGTDRPGALVPLAESFKQVLTVPVMIVGRMTPEVSETALRENKTDLVVVGTALLADPEMPNKAASGRLEDIRPCIRCWGCIPEEHFVGQGIWEQKEGVHCTVNAAMGRERELEIKPVAKPRRVVIVGGGPAGMEAARVAVLRGHQVSLLEKESQLGGLLHLAALAPQKELIRDLTQYLIAQVSKLGVDVRLKAEAYAELIQSLQPDVVVLATGAEPLVPQIRGLDGRHVVTALDVLAGKAEVGEKVVVIGGALVGCETAEILAHRGRKVTVTRRGPEMATGISVPLRAPLLQRLETMGVTLRPGVKYEELTDRGLVITNEKGEKQIIAADSVVLAAGGMPRIELFESLQGRVPEIHRIGDCLEPGGIREAILAGARARLL